MLMHEFEQRRRLSPPAARAAPPVLLPPFPQPDPSPQSPSFVTSLYRIPIRCSSTPLSQKTGYRRETDQSDICRARLDAKAEYPCLPVFGKRKNASIFRSFSF